MPVDFANPGFAAGGFALLAPVLVHLLTRHTRRQITFPSVRFLRAAAASRSSLHKFRHLFLFLVRTAALAALVLAFMRPELRRRDAAAAEASGGPSTTVIVLDASASMGYRVAGGAVFERAKLAALQTAQGLASADQANLIVAGAKPRCTFDKPSAGRVLLEREIRNAALTAERADMDAALAEAVRQLGRAPRAELVVVSDFQRSTWAAVDWTRIPATVLVVLVPAAEGRLINAGIDDVRVQPPFPAAGEDVEITCRVLNRSEEGATFPVALTLGERDQLTRELFVPAGVSQSVTFRLKVGEPGPLECVLSIPDDRLTVDNTYYTVIPVAGRLSVLVVSDEPERDPRGAVPLLLRAIDPHGGGPDSVMLARRIPSSALGALSPALHPVVMLAGVGPLEPAAADSLLQYVRAGGSLVLFLCTRQDAANLARLQSRSAGELALPFKAGELLDSAAHPTTLAQANFEHPVLHKFRDSDDLSRIAFRRRFATERAEKAGQVLAKYADNNIAMASQLFGAGTLLVCNFSPAPEYSDLPRRTLFVPLVHEIVRGLKPGRSGTERSPAAGDICSAVVPGWRQDQPIRFTAPDGSLQSATFNMRHDETAILFTDTARLGFYRVWVQDRLAASAAVNLDRRESDLARLEAAQLRELAKGAAASVALASEPDERLAGSLRRGIPLWPWCLLAVLLLLAAEQGLALAWRGV
jgi:hypothetical protein